MNISGLSALLTELAYQTASKVEPAARAEGAARVQDGTAPGRIRPETAAGLSSGQPASAGPDLPEGETVLQPAFAPLPLRTGLFQEARFFARLGGYGAGAEAGPGEITDIFLCLFTENIGRVWVGLSCRNDALSVKYFTDSRITSKVIEDNFSLLRGELREIGFTEVSLTSRTKAELGTVLEGLLPRFERHLLDRKI